jgi:hypothetical protein
MNYGALATSQAVTDTTYTITVPGDGGDLDIIFTEVDATAIDVDMGAGNIAYTKL